jgi:hypothetical protein
VSATRAAIVENLRGVGIIDAYAAALSLDAATLPNPASAPVRLAILDSNDDGKFDESDLDTFLDKLFTSDDTQRDYGRFDLNGDGFTGGETTERFDLDRLGSTQFGATRYGVVTQAIAGETISFDENDLTDLQILCYYAYSDFYTGDAGMREQLTAGRCGVTVAVAPKSATIAPAMTQQFVATVRGAVDARVTWTATGGTVDANGLFTAGATPGAGTVRATSVADPNAADTAAVTIQNAAGRYAGTLTFTLDDPGPLAVKTDVSLSVVITADVVGNTDLVVRSASGSIETSTADMECGPTTLNGVIVGFFQPAPDLLPIFPDTERPTSFSFVVSGTVSSFAGSPDTGCVKFEDPFEGPYTGFALPVTNVLRNAGEVVEIDFDKTTNIGEQTTIATGRLVPSAPP